MSEFDAIVQNDYDGDNLTDIAVWRETEGIFYYLKSTDNTYGSQNWGIISDIPVASYDSH